MVGAITPEAMVQVVLSGLTTGAIYALLLVGIVLVFQVSRVINFAYGEYGGVAALLVLFLTTTFHLAAAVAVIVGIIAACVLSWATYVVLIKRIGEVGTSGRDLLITLGLLLLLEAGAEQAFGVNPQEFLPLGENTIVHVGGYVIDAGQVAALVVCAVIVVGFGFLLRSTSLGLRLRAVASRPDVAASVGLNVVLLRSGTWAITGGLAALGGMLFGSQLSVDPFYMTNIIILVFVAGLIGGLGHFWAPVLCGVMLGVFESVVQYTMGANAGTPAVFVLTVVVLLALPKAWVVEQELERA